MNQLLQKSVKVSAIVHVSVVVVLVLVPLILNWRERRKTPHEIVTYIDIQAALPEPAQVVPVEEIKVPEPPKDIPEPPKKKKKKIEKSKKKIKREAEKKPKQPQLTPEEIKKLLDAGVKPTQTSQVKADDLPAWYYALVKQTMYDVWDQPSGLSATAGLMATVSIRVERSGRITRRSMIKKSGDSAMDASVMKAVNLVSQLKSLPPSFRGKYKDITVYFELTGQF
jgi:TonB family protein